MATFLGYPVYARSCPIRDIPPELSPTQKLFQNLKLEKLGPLKLGTVGCSLRVLDPRYLCIYLWLNGVPVHLSYKWGDFGCVYSWVYNMPGLVHVHEQYMNGLQSDG